MNLTASLAGAHATAAKPLKKHDMFRACLVLAIAIAALAIPFQPWLYPVFVMKIMCFALFASAFNLLLGYGGLLSFGHAAFFGAAAYTTAHLCKAMAFGPGMGLAAGVAVAALLGALMGGLAIRRQGIYFAMVTLALAQLVYFVAIQAPFTGGEDGIQNVPRGRLFGVIDLANDAAMYYVVLLVFVGAVWLLHRTVQSPFGEVLQAIRENESRAISLGYNVDRFKMLAFVLSAAFAGLAGSLKVLVFQVATLSDVHWHASGEVVLMTLLGGVATLFGPIVGATVVVALQNVLAGAGSWSTVVIGLVFMACVLAFRKGIVGELSEALRRLRRI
nr:branched-chain amino acid ABC transporter permease [Ramlibacter sp. WS9]